MSADISIVDYGSGNLFGLMRAFETIGATVNLTANAIEISAANRLVLPGVGAFGRAAGALRGKGLFGAIQNFAHSGRPFLGICVGMQLMMDHGTEFGHHEGLGLISGMVNPIPKQSAKGESHPVPHIGWSPIEPAAEDWSGTLLEGTTPGQEMYFLHSFAAKPDAPSHILANTTYNGCKIVGAIQSGNITGFQFHPEKSGKKGLAVLTRFLNRL